MRLSSLLASLIVTAPIILAARVGDPFNNSVPFGEPDTGIPIGGPMTGTPSTDIVATGRPLTGRSTTGTPTTGKPTTGKSTTTTPPKGTPTNSDNGGGDDGDDDGGDDGGDYDDGDDFATLETDLIPMSNRTFHIHRYGKNRSYQLQTFPFGKQTPSSCALYIRFQQDHGIKQSRNKLIYVFLVDNNGKVKPYGPKDGRNVAGQFFVTPTEMMMVNHFSCAGMKEMRFQFRIAGDRGPGDVSFVGDEWNGIFLSVK